MNGGRESDDGVAGPVWVLGKGLEMTESEGDGDVVGAEGVDEEGGRGRALWCLAEGGELELVLASACVAKLPSGVRDAVTGFEGVLLAEAVPADDVELEPTPWTWTWACLISVRWRFRGGPCAWEAVSVSRWSGVWRRVVVVAAGGEEEPVAAGWPLSLSWPKRHWNAVQLFPFGQGMFLRAANDMTDDLLVGI